MYVWVFVCVCVCMAADCEKGALRCVFNSQLLFQICPIECLPQIRWDIQIFLIRNTQSSVERMKNTFHFHFFSFAFSLFLLFLFRMLAFHSIFQYFGLSTKEIKNGKNFLVFWATKDSCGWRGGGGFWCFAQLNWMNEWWRFNLGNQIEGLRNNRIPEAPSTQAPMGWITPVED